MCCWKVPHPPTLCCFFFRPALPPMQYMLLSSFFLVLLPVKLGYWHKCTDVYIRIARLTAMAMRKRAPRCAVRRHRTPWRAAVAVQCAPHSFLVRIDAHSSLGVHGTIESVLFWSIACEFIDPVWSQAHRLFLLLMYFPFTVVCM